jgi:hypothetical protein
MKSNSNNKMKKRLFWLFTIDPQKENGFKTKKALSEVTDKGYQLDNLFIFESEFTCKEINEKLKKIDNNYQFFLIDMTDNITEDSFKAVLKPRIYKYATELANIIKEYRQTITSFNTQSTQEIIDRILDKISSSGIESLTDEEKKFLEENAK